MEQTKLTHVKRKWFLGEIRVTSYFCLSMLWAKENPPHPAPMHATLGLAAAERERVVLCRSVGTDSVAARLTRGTNLASML